MIYCNVCSGTGGSGTFKKKTCDYCGGSGIDYEAMRQNEADKRQKAEREKREVDERKSRQTNKKVGTGSNPKGLTQNDIGVGVLAGIASFAYLSTMQAIEPMVAGFLGLVAGAIAAHTWKVVLGVGVVGLVAYVFLKSNGQ